MRGSSTSPWPSGELPSALLTHTHRHVHRHTHTHCPTKQMNSRCSSTVCDSLGPSGADGTLVRVIPSPRLPSSADQHCTGCLVNETCCDCGTSPPLAAFSPGCSGGSSDTTTRGLEDVLLFIVMATITSMLTDVSPMPTDGQVCSSCKHCVEQGGINQSGRMSQIQDDTEIRP